MMYTFAGITGHAALWAELGYDVRDEQGYGYGHPTNASDVGVSHSLVSRGLRPAATTGELMAAAIAAGAADDRALAWLIDERKRQSEERARQAAIAKQGDDAIHAARIHRQAARIEYKARLGKDAEPDLDR